MKHTFGAALGLFFVLLLGGAPAGAVPPPAGPPNVLLLTLDTTRADALGAYLGKDGGREARTPALDGLAARGLRWAQAIAPTPLTLPAHASLLTGLAPPEHGVRINGANVLPREIPTLAEAYNSRGYATAGFVASPVLDRHFGLARGFGHYSDTRTLERTAREMTDAGLKWLGRQPAGKPLFLWVHYHDPHAPYFFPGMDPKATLAQRYAGEVANMDREIGRLLAALPGGAERWLIAAVGDHGESLGEHGEPDHGIFLYHSTMRVPLLLAGPGVPRGKVVKEAVSTRRLASTLLRLTGSDKSALPFGRPLPGLPGLNAGPPSPVYMDNRYTLTAYGWSPLEGMFDGRYKLIVAPRPELYDLAADPGETRNLLEHQEGRPQEGRQHARRLKAALQEAQRSFAARPAHSANPAEAADPELTRSLESLGYLSGSGTSGKGTLDPKDGPALLAELAAAQELMQRKNWPQAVARLKEVVRRSPGSVRFLTNLARAHLENGEDGAAIATYRQAVRENPRRVETHLELAAAYRRLGREAEAKKEDEVILQLRPRSEAADE
jgi:arylsulfatase A-like enzyme